MALHLLAQSEADVPVLSAVVQDAAVRRVDISYDPRARRVIVLMARYCWDIDTPTRSRCALRIDHVEGMQQRGMDDSTTLELLSLSVHGTQVHLTFAGKATLRLHIETIDMSLDDFGEPWSATRVPKH
jgi:hypothetical protein